MVKRKITLERKRIKKEAAGDAA